ncbi:hypothetical protein ON010_g2481 [Phytophthora cinnamomi]|nr:hypothetical protein ON010_g2481 [Phytophthora cinnamomi]
MSAYLELLERIEVLELGDAVVIETQVRELDEVFQPLDGGNVVEGQVQPLEVDEVADAVDLLQHVVVQLQLDEVTQRLEVLHLKDVLERQRQRLQLDEVHALVGLVDGAVVGRVKVCAGHLLDELIADHGHLCVPDA